jgi:hypothetical protein
LPVQIARWYKLPFAPHADAAAERSFDSTGRLSDRLDFDLEPDQSDSK